jgi:D-glycero-D-manno-heptose 1,7-bisphosphate phosphatase
MTILRKALFLDRDGVINVEKNYVYRIEDFEFVDGIFDLCTCAQSLGFKLIVITNQAGIGRGYYTESDFAQLTQWMLQQFASREICIDRVYHCPFHPTAGIGAYRQESYDRKPNPGMIMKAQADFDLDLANSVLVGDKDSDIEAGRAAGIHCNLKLLHPPIHAVGHLEFISLEAIKDWLLNRFGHVSHAAG